jgi:hypothetical protein
MLLSAEDFAVLHAQRAHFDPVTGAKMLLKLVGRGVRGGALDTVGSSWELVNQKERTAAHNNDTRVRDTS